MTAPTPRHIGNLVGRLAHTDWAALEQRLAAALARNTGGTTVPDGFPTSTLGTGSRGTAELTPVEAAAHHRLTARPEGDPIRDHTLNACQFLLDADLAIGACLSRLAAIDNLTDTQPAPDQGRHTGSGQCQACGQWCSGADHDRLRSGYCDGCRKAWDRAGRPDRATFNRDRRVPTETAGT